MKYLVIELEESPHILCNYKFSDGPYEPIIYEDKNSAFRDASKCKKGLVYPITDIMKMFERIKLIAKEHDAIDILDELMALVNEVV